MPTLLIVEDERDINYLLRTHFKKEGYTVFAAGTAEAGLKLAQKHRPDLFLLDITLPKMDGLELMQKLRETSSAPVLFLTAKKDEVDRILGLKMGADDYITKPFSIRELSLRVKAILRHTAPAAQASDAKVIRVGGVVLDFERHEVRVNGRPVGLAPKEFLLLKLLIEADGKVLSREQLARNIWGEDESMEFEIRTVDQHIARLRKKLLTERGLIATVSNFGYQIRKAGRVPEAKLAKAAA
jgi:two-component system alkaline phosphatase synthesis response regulator PhoP